MNLPSEQFDLDSRSRVAQFERKVLVVLTWLSPVLLLAVWVLAGWYGRYWLFLQPTEAWTAFVASKGAVACALLVPFCLMVWWGSVRFSLASSPRFCTLAAVAGAVGVFSIANVAFLVPSAVWYFQEAVKVRAPQLNFARNIVSMEQRLAHSKVASPEGRIALIGSSQINLGIDEKQLASSLGDVEVSKFCMPGMVPMQYQALASGIIQQRPTVAVCWLSEFDFFRERELPSGRLRWCMNGRNLSQLLSVLRRDQWWTYRADLADLSVASVCPVWQQRELFQMLAFRFWWRFDAEQVQASKEELQVGAAMAGTEAGIQNAAKNIVRTPLLDASFAAFNDFQSRLKQAGVKLYVIEGESHPDAMAVYSADFRIETRLRLQKLAAGGEFVYVPAEKRIAFEKSDWMDAVHLNDVGRQKLTRFVVELLSLSNDYRPRN